MKFYTCPKTGKQDDLLLQMIPRFFITILIVQVQYVVCHGIFASSMESACGVLDLAADYIKNFNLSETELPVVTMSFAQTLDASM
jgi:hypothetical protein